MSLPTDTGDRERIAVVDLFTKQAYSEGLDTGEAPIMTPAQYAGVVPASVKEAVAPVIKMAVALPWRLPGYTVSNLPAAASYTGCIVYCSNGAAGSPVVAFSDGSNWKRCDNLANVS